MTTTVDIIDAPRFARAFLATALAAGDDTTLPALTGVALSFNDQGYSLAATDRYRLHVVRCSGDIPSGRVDVVVPAKTVAKLLAPVSRERRGAPRGLTVTVDSDRVTFTLASSGKYPGGSLTVDLITADYPKLATFTVEPAGITCDTVAAVNPEFMSDAVKGAEIIAGKSAPARISPWAQGKPVRVRAHDGDADRATDYLAVVMPIRLTGEAVTADNVPLYGQAVTV